MKTLLLLTLSMFLFSCEPEQIEQIEKIANENEIETNNNTGFQKVSCNPYSVQKLACQNLKSNSYIANIVQTCNSKGNGRFDGPCIVESCQDGFVLSENECTFSSCQPSTNIASQCASEISNASIATRSSLCNSNGSSLKDGPCNLQQCQNGYYKSGNVCRPQVCAPNSKSKISCSAGISNASTANITRTCNSAGTNFTDSGCALESCQPGHIQVGGTCVKQICISNSTVNQDCTQYIAYAKDAKRNVNCNYNGTQETNGSCQLLVCNSGFTKIGNSCTPQSCTPNQVNQITCVGEIPNAQVAQKTQTCNNAGTGATAGLCSLQSCNSGFYKVGNACVKQACTPNQSLSISCVADIPNSIIASFNRTCDALGTNQIDSACSLDTCAVGYTKDGETCVQQLCTPNASRTVSCTADILNSTGATKKLTCAADGKTETETACTLKTCDTGYNASSNTCIAQACTPTATRDITCAGDIPNAATAEKTLICSADGTSEVPGVCSLITCNQGYTVNGNTCTSQTGNNPGNNPPNNGGGGNRFPASVTGEQWLDLSLKENRDLIGLKRAYGEIGQSCAEWLATSGKTISAVGTTNTYKDAARISYLAEKAAGKLSAIKNYEDFRSSHYSKANCTYRWENGGGINICRTVPLLTPKDKIKNYGIGNNPSQFRPVARCFGTSNWASSKGDLYLTQSLHVKVDNFTPTKQYVAYDAQYFNSHGITNQGQRGNLNESATEFYSRLGLVTAGDQSVNYIRKTYFDVRRYQDYKKEVDTGTPVPIYSQYYSTNDFAPTSWCLYVVPNGNNMPKCTQRLCNHKNATDRPVLSCYFESGWNDKTKGEAFALDQMGFVDKTSSEKLGVVFNTLEKSKQLGMTEIKGPLNTSTKDWLASQGIKYTKKGTFRELEDAAYTNQAIEIKRYLTSGIGTTYPEGLYKEDRVYSNQCPYLTYVKATGVIHNCARAACDITPRPDPAFESFPVLSCEVASAWKDLSENRAYLRYSLILNGVSK